MANELKCVLISRSSEPAMIEAVKKDPTRTRWMFYQDDSRMMVWNLSKREDEAEDGNEEETNVSTARRRRTRTSKERN